MIHFTKENITFILALIGSLGTIVNWLRLFIVNNKNFNIRPVAYRSKDNITLFYLLFENKSRMPISITELSVQINGVYYPCRYLPEIVTSSHRTIGKEIVSSHDYFNIAFPVQLGALGATSGYVLFILPKDIQMPDSKTLTFLVTSNRGKAVEKIISVDQVPEIH